MPPHYHDRVVSHCKATPNYSFAKWLNSSKPCVLLALAVSTGCSTVNTSLPTPTRNNVSTTSTREIKAKYTIIRDRISSQPNAPRRLYGRLTSIKSPSKSRESVALKKYDALADVTPLSIIMQPGDQCGNNPPVYKYFLRPEFCVAWTYDNQVDPSCGNLQWNVDSSSLPAGSTVLYTPTTQPSNDIMAMSVILPSNASPGEYTYTVGATCSSSFAQAKAGTILPDSTTSNLFVATTTIMDQTAAPAVSVNSPGFLHDSVGQEELLSAAIAPSSLQPLAASGNWTIPAVGDPQFAYVDSYTETLDHSTTKPVDLIGSSLHFFPIQGANSLGNINFAAAYSGPGTGFHASAGYQIDAPTATVSYQSSPYTIGTTVDNAESPPISSSIKLGGATAAAPGITWSATFNSPSSNVVGQVGMTQLDFFYHGWGSDPNAVPAYAIFSFGFKVDQAVQYPLVVGRVKQTNSLTSGLLPLVGQQSTLWTTTESPSMKLYPCTSYAFTSDQYQNYFVFIPTPKAGFTSIPVPTAFVSWFAFAETTQAGSPSYLSTNWTRPDNYGISPDYPTFSTDATQAPPLPQWSGGSVNNAMASYNNNLPPC